MPVEQVPAAWSHQLKPGEIVVSFRFLRDRRSGDAICA